MTSSKPQKGRLFAKNKAACRRKGGNGDWDREEKMTMEYNLFLLLHLGLLHDTVTPLALTEFQFTSVAQSPSSGSTFLKTVNLLKVDTLQILVGSSHTHPGPQPFLTVGKTLHKEPL